MGAGMASSIIISQVNQINPSLYFLDSKLNLTTKAVNSLSTNIPIVWDCWTPHLLCAVTRTHKHSLQIMPCYLVPVTWHQLLLSRMQQTTFAAAWKGTTNSNAVNCSGWQGWTGNELQWKYNCTTPETEHMWLLLWAAVRFTESWQHRK